MNFPILFLFILFVSCVEAQKPMLVGGPCEGCEAIFEYGDRQLSSTDTLPDFKGEGIPIKVKGTVYEADGKTPAEGVIIYAYHTNQDGIYKARDDSRGWENRHGYIRGWVKTNEKGNYAFYTLKPGAYPSGSEPAHIHYTILEPDGRYYWLSSCHFEGDPLLSKNETDPDTPRGGTSGLLSLREADGILTGTRDIILGRNVRGY